VEFGTTLRRCSFKGRSLLVIRAEWSRLEERERLLDVHNVANSKYSTERFPTSCVQAYEELCLSSGHRIDKVIANQIRRTAKAAFENDPPVMAVPKRLRAPSFEGTRLALLTKGDHELQSRRIDVAGFASSLT